MEFSPYHANAIDVKQAWMSINAAKEVDIILNTNDEYELWIGKEFVAMYDTFNTARRYVESVVSFTVKSGAV